MEHTTALFDKEFELFKQSTYYHALNDEGSEWNLEVRAMILAGFINLIQVYTNDAKSHIPEISQFAYFGVNQRADQSEVHVSFYTDMLPEHLSVDHNPRKLFLAIIMKDHAPELYRGVQAASPFAMSLELPEIIQFHALSYPIYMHPIDVIPKAILQFLSDEGYYLAGYHIDWEAPDTPNNLKGPITLFLKNDAPTRKFPFLSVTYNHQVFIEDFQWLSANAPQKETNDQET